MIHTFGDSHSQFAFEKCKNVIVNHIGPVLMYSIAKRGLNLKKYHTINNDHYYIFCFGEIDIRCHVNLHITKDKPYNIIIDELVDNYFKMLNNETVDLIKNKCVYNVVPPCFLDSETKRHPDWPFRGTNEERILYTKYINKKMKEYCEKYNYYFIDTFPYYADDNGFLIKKLSDGWTHINDPTYLKIILNNIFLNKIEL